MFCLTDGEALVVLDSLGSFHFQQKITEASAGDGAAFTQQPIRSLLRLVKERSVLILAAKPMLFKPRGSTKYTMLRVRLTVCV